MQRYTTLTLTLSRPQNRRFLACWPDRANPVKHNGSEYTSEFVSDFLFM